MPKMVEVRIDASGKVVASDRRAHAARNPAHGGPDQVKWLRTPGNTGTFRIDFTPYLKGSPFEKAEIDVPPGGPETVTGDKGEYKYDVYTTTSGSTLTDDPDVIIE